VSLINKWKVTEFKYAVKCIKMAEFNLKASYNRTIFFINKWGWERIVSGRNVIEFTYTKR